MFGVSFVYARKPFHAIIFIEKSGGAKCNCRSTHVGPGVLLLLTTVLSVYGHRL